MQYFFYPPAGANTSVSNTGSPVPAQATLIAGKNGSGNLTAVSVDASGNVNTNVISAVLPTGAATAAKQDTGNTSLASIDSKLTSPITVTGPLTDTQLRASAVPVSAASLPLPTGASTSALQTTGNTSLASIDSKLTSPLTVTVSSSTLPTGAATEATLAAFSAKTAGAFVPQAFDYATITYVGATTDISTVVYKTGGAGGSTVATLTMGYDGSSRLTSVTRT